MDIQVITIYCLYDDMLKAFHHRDDSQCQMTDAEVMTTALVTALFFGRNFKKAHSLLQSASYVVYEPFQPPPVPPGNPVPQLV